MRESDRQGWVSRSGRSPCLCDLLSQNASTTLTSSVGSGIGGKPITGPTDHDSGLAGPQTDEAHGTEPRDTAQNHETHRGRAGARVGTPDLPPTSWQ